MEKNVAILMADLSGYTALTETHGSVSAANLIDRYIHIAEKSLVGDCKLHERTGDEIMFVSNSSDSLLATALRLEASTSKEDNFLQVHGGLHYGKVLKRSDNYFGLAVNLTSRIAGKATTGTFWCSGDFINSIRDKSVCTFQSKGSHLFKNIREEKEVFELNIGKTKNKYIDPVCQMLIQNPKNAIHYHGEDELYFCSSLCFELYKEGLRFVDTAQNLN